MAARQPVVIGREPPPAIMAFGEGVEERRRDRRGRIWAATVEIRGDGFAGRILDFAPAPRQLDFGSPVGGRDALPELLLRLDRLGAPLLWRRDSGEGAQLLFAPRELAARLRGVLPPLPDPSGEPAAKPSHRRAPGRARRIGLTAAGSGLAAAALALMLSTHSDDAAGGREGDAAGPLAVMAGAVDQHSCPQLLGRVTGATNQIDFSLHVAAAAQAKCLDLQHGGVATEPEGHMVQATKVPLR